MGLSDLGLSGWSLEVSRRLEDLRMAEDSSMSGYGWPL